MSQPHERLDKAMRRRGIQLGKRWVQIAADAGITTSALGAIRRGEYRPSAHTAAALDEALEWVPGSVERILEGGDPLPADHPPADAMGATEAILDDMERRVADMKRLSRRDLAAIDALIEALKNPDPNDAPADNNHR